MSRKLFGRSSEKLDPNQRDFLLEFFASETKAELDEQAEEVSPEPSRKRKAAKPKAKAPADLEVVEEILIPDIVRSNPELWKEISREVLEQLDYIPGKFLRRLTIRPKYTRRDNTEEPPVIEPAPPRILERGVAAPGLLAHLLISKYADHLPCYRQSKIFAERHQVHIDRNQITQWIGKCADYLEIIYNQIKEDVLKSQYLQVDETPITYTDKLAHKGSAKGYLWVYMEPQKGVVFDWRTNRSTDGLRKFLGSSFSGTIQCDGYSSYDTYARENTQTRLIGCWAHTRRKFENSKDENPTIALEILKTIGELYRIERELRDARAGPDQRFEKRQNDSLPIAIGLHQRLQELATQLPPKSGLGQAVSYALGQWPKLIAAFESGICELDTNLVENQIRPSAIGKKNWLFVGHRDAGKRAAILYTLIQTCRIHQVEPYAYLRDVLERLPHATNQTVADLTPSAWSPKS